MMWLWWDDGQRVCAKVRQRFVAVWFSSDDGFVVVEAVVVAAVVAVVAVAGVGAG